MFGECLGGPPPQEVCNLEDDDCDGLVDEGVLVAIADVGVANDTEGAVCNRAVIQGNDPYAIAWESDTQDGPPWLKRDIYVRIVGGDGTLLTKSKHIVNGMVDTLSSMAWDGDTTFAVAVGVTDCNPAKLVRFDASANLLGSTSLGNTGCTSPFATWAGNEWGVAINTNLARVSQEGTLLKEGARCVGGNPQIVWTGADYGVVYVIDDTPTGNTRVQFVKLDAGGSQTTSPLTVGSTDCCGSVSEPALLWTGSEFVVVWIDDDRYIWRTRIEWEGEEVIADTRLHREYWNQRFSLTWNEVRQEIGVLYQNDDTRMTTFGRMTLTSEMIYDPVPVGYKYGTILANEGDYIIAINTSGTGDRKVRFLRYGCP
jgi:hypothetical protein